MRKPHAVLFDLWGTLLSSVEFDPRRGHAAVLAACDNPRGTTLDEVMELGHRIISATIPREEESSLEYTQQQLFAMIADAFALRPRQGPEECEWLFWQEAMRVSLVEGVRELLEGLGRMGMPLGVVSNSSFAARTLERELSRHGIGDSFRFVVSSADYGVRKPDPLIFEVALRRFPLDAGRAWFAGDNVGYDLIGASGAGLFPVAFNPRNEIPESVGEHAAISSWDEFLPLLASASPD
ncbi:MAG TPA: HAD family hydrolase [Spirochaetia bacterium]|nr:HAD family hydrolase [Spirochaetia bacterium]